MSEEYIGNYRVVSMIGRGGMGRVYLAVHKDVPNLRVILKILSDPRLADRFKQEADKLALLDGHPNICQIKHFFNHGDDLVIAMEYIDGQTLDERLKREGRLAVAEAIRIACDMLAILAYAHARGISHRDIKPSNVMIDRSGQVKIIDFGIAKGKGDVNLTTTGASLGTPNYMAPEQFIPQADTDYTLADIYACGTTLFQMLTGDLPFKADNEFILRDAKLTGKVPSPRSLNPGVSKELEKAILRSLDKEPSRRFAGAEEMRKALQVILREERLQGDQPTEAVSTGPVGASSPSPVRKKSRAGMYALIGGLVLLIAAVVAWFALRPGGGSAQAEAPELVEPVDGATVANDRPILLRWRPTLTEKGVYKVEYSADSGFSAPRQVRTSADSTVFPPGVPPGIYRWRVTAMPDNGQPGPVSTVRTLTVEGSAAVQGTLIVALTPSGDLYLDDRLVAEGRSQIETAADTGVHEIRVENSRAASPVIRDTVRLGAGQTVTRQYSFTMAQTGAQVRPPAGQTTRPAVKPAEVRVGSRPRGATIYVDGERQAVQTNNTVWLLPGRHEIVVALVLDDTEQRRIDTVIVVADSVHKVLFDFEQ